MTPWCRRSLLVGSIVAIGSIAAWGCATSPQVEVIPGTTTKDAGRDTGTHIDAGSSFAYDAGEQLSYDATTGDDATSSEDTGSPIDANLPVDAGAGDVSVPEDANTPEDAGAAPTTCAAANQAAGCCYDNTNYYCLTPTSNLATKTCSGSQVCGWNASKGYYSCVAAPGGPDPSGTNPITCSQ